MNKTKLLLAAMLASCALQMGCATMTAEEVNARDGRLIIVADITSPPKPGAIDRATGARPRGDSYGEGGQLAGAAASGGAGVGGALLGGILFGAAMEPASYDSRRRIFRVVQESQCKQTTSMATAEKADIGGLTAGAFADKERYPNWPGTWMKPITGRDGKPIAKIDASHPCFAAYEAAVREYAAEKQAAQAKSQSAAK